MTPDLRSGRYAASTGRSDAARLASKHALAALEAALGAPTPGREQQWLVDVTASLDEFVATLADPEASEVDLLAEIADNEPRFRHRIDRLRNELDDLIASARSLREQIQSPPQEPVDTADIRDRLAGITRRYRQYRAREADLVFEAINVTLGSSG